ncbi:hypothetical protein [Streptomyces sp. BK340]|uniref:hypothetical protein n=1 Tax=Streptomyces sp. BK340 TaxID=2572903 RepID=UPI0011AD19AC|nr:hypothetical protein [Streptomyces sp. BK340]TVZ94271.1 hypothetical protein FB157_105339 [Streptomyces sp. BK340]
MKPTVEPGAAALHPVEREPGMLVRPGADRRLAVEHWLLSAHPAPEQARLEWQEQKVALLPLGTLFSAVRIPGRLVFAAAGTAEFGEVDAFLDDALDGGPVICDPRGLRYYALVPVRVPITWRQAADEWRATAAVELLGCGTYLGVPRVTEVDFDPWACVSYWCVPMSTALCAPLRVARLITAGQHVMAEEQ